MLEFDKNWRFASPGEIPDGVVRDYIAFINRIVGQTENPKAFYEHFKRKFAGAAGASYGESSNLDWARGDMQSAMWDAAKNAATFIEAFYDGVTELERANSRLGLPDVVMMNRVLFEHEVPYEIRPPYLISKNPHTPITVPEIAPSFNQAAQEKIFQSLDQMDRFLAEGRERPAVQEGLWLLESVVHAFQGIETEAGTIQGKYFNKIAGDLKRQFKGAALQQVLEWATELHGYLSSPTGGGIRHGADLHADPSVNPQVARLYCNLIRSYISYLIAEHQRLSARV